MRSFNVRKLRRFFACLLLVLIIVGGAVTYQLVQWRTVTIGIMSSPGPSTLITNVVRVQAKPSQKRIYAISLDCRGKLDGVGTIALDGFPELVVSNNFDMRIRKRDWYSTDCEIALITTNVQTGTVVISYQFHDY
jgi:hypothetical protein